MSSLEQWAQEQVLQSYRAFMEWLFQQVDWSQIITDMDTVDAAVGVGEPWPEAMVAVERLLSVAVRYERVGAWVSLFEGLGEQWNKQGGDANGGD